MLTPKTKRTQNNKGSQEPIRIASPWGKGTIVVGYIKGTTFYKRVSDKAILNEAFLDDAFAINRGRAGAQKCLCLNGWLPNGEPQKNTPKKKSKKRQRQLKLGGM